MRLSCRRVLAGDAADQPGRLGGVLSAAGAQRAAPGQREPGREGDPQLRAGGQGRPGRAGPAGVVDLAVPDPGAGRAPPAGARRGRGAGLPPAGWGVDAGPDLGAARDRRRDPPGRRRAAPGRRAGRAGGVRAGRAAGPASRARSWPRPAGWPSGWRSSGCPGFTDDPAYPAMDFLLDALPEIAAEVFASVAHLLNLDLDIVFVDTTSHLLGDRDRRRATRAGRPGRRRRDQQPHRGRDAGVRALQGPPRRSAAGGDRDGGHPRRGPGAVLDLPRRHRRHRDHPHRQGRPGRGREPCHGL